MSILPSEQAKARRLAEWIEAARREDGTTNLDALERDLAATCARRLLGGVQRDARKRAQALQELAENLEE